MTLLCAPSSVGDVIDRITILQLKAMRLSSAEGRQAAVTETALLTKALEDAGVHYTPLHPEAADLAEVNAELWDLEDAMRTALKAATAEDIAGLSRSIVAGNAKRAALKQQINQRSGSGLVEYKDYG